MDFRTMEMIPLMMWKSPWRTSRAWVSLALKIWGFGKLEVEGICYEIISGVLVVLELMV